MNEVQSLNPCAVHLVRWSLLWHSYAGQALRNTGYCGRPLYLLPVIMFFHHIQVVQRASRETPIVDEGRNSGKPAKLQILELAKRFGAMHRRD